MEHVLVIQLARFGDLVQTKRLLASLAARPGTRVHLCLDASLVPLARLVYPDVALHPLAAHGTGLTGAGTRAVLQAMLGDNRRTFAELSAIDFNEIYNLNFSPLNFQAASLFDPDRVRGFSWTNGQERRGSWPSLAMRWSSGRRLGLNLVDFWAHLCPDPVAPRSVNPSARPAGGGLGVVLAGRESRRSLPPEVLARLAAARFLELGHGEVLLLGSRAEAGAARAVHRALPSKVASKTRDLAGRTDWVGLVEAVSGLDEVLTPDTGTMHLAAHLGVPVTAFFLSSAWCFETGPYGEGHRVFQAVTECLPCLETRPCPEEHRCLRPFLEPGFVRFLSTGRGAHAPEGVLGLTSVFDDLGVLYEAFAGQDADRTWRLDFRNFLSRHLHLPGAEQGRPQSDLARRLYQEPDWMMEKIC